MQKRSSKYLKVLMRSIAIAFVVAGFCIPAFAEPLDVVITPRPPYYDVDDNGRVSGLVAGPAANCFAKAGLEPKWSVVSFNRQLQMIEDNDGPLCAIGWFKNAEPEKFAKFTDYIYQDRAMIALARKDNQAVASHEALRAIMGDRSLKLGKRLGFSYGTEVDRLIEELDPNSITTDQSNIGMTRMLMGRRFDYLISAPEEAEHMIDSLGDDGKVLTMISLQDMKPQNKRYILCSKSVSDEVIERLNVAIRQTR